MSRYTNAERAGILERSYELLNRDVLADTRQVEPEVSHDELLREAYAQPLETRNQRDIRKIEEHNAMRKAERAAEDLEARFRREREAIFKALGQVLATHFAPQERRLAELRDRIDNMKGRDGVSVTAAAINHRGELLLTLSDGSQLCPGRVVAKASDRVESGDVIDLPPVLEARRGWR